MNLVFDNYSKYYDLLYQDKDYSGEAEYIYELIKKFSPSSKTILELGCGTGKHASILCKKGYDVFGIDMSKTMLEKAKVLGVNCKLGDARFFRCEKKFDIVLSLFHVASYQVSDEDVLNFFDTASLHLEQGGIFIFDLWYKPAVLTQMPEKRVKKIEDNEIKVVRYCNPNHFPEKSTIEVIYDIEITDKQNGRIEKVNEKHIMRYFHEKEIEKFALEKGLEIIHSEEWVNGNTPSEKTWGVCFVGVKK